MIGDYNIKNGDVLIQTKAKLKYVKGLLLSYDEEDILGLAKEGEAKARMPCGHFISTDSMTLHLKSLVKT